MSDDFMRCRNCGAGDDYIDKVSGEGDEPDEKRIFRCTRCETEASLASENWGWVHVDYGTRPDGSYGVIDL